MVNLIICCSDNLTVCGYVKVKVIEGQAVLLFVSKTRHILRLYCDCKDVNMLI